MGLNKWVFKSLVLFNMVFCFSGIAAAATLFPDDIGRWYEYNRYDSAEPRNEWKKIGTDTYFFYNFWRNYEEIGVCPYFRNM